MLYEDLGGLVIEPDGLDKVMTRIELLLNERRPSVLVIDSFKALRPFATSAASYRAFLHRLAGQLSARPISALLLGEYTEEEIGTAPEFAVADVVVSLAFERNGYRTSRISRCSRCVADPVRPGATPTRSAATGLEVFPRVADPIDTSRYQQHTERVSTGIAAIDVLIDDGYWPGSDHAHRWTDRHRQDTDGVALPLSWRSPRGAGHLGDAAGIARAARPDHARVRMDHRRPGIHVYGRSPVGLLVDEWMHHLLNLAEETGARRLVVDSIDDLAVAAADQQRFREYMYSLTQRCARRQISLLMTHEIPRAHRTHPALRARPLPPVGQRRAAPIRAGRGHAAPNHHRLEDPSQRPRATTARLLHRP